MAFYLPDLLVFHGVRQTCCHPNDLMATFGEHFTAGTLKPSWTSMNSFKTFIPHITRFIAPWRSAPHLSREVIHHLIYKSKYFWS